MRIINQNKNISLNFDDLAIVCDECVIHTKVDGRTVILGRYKDVERANDVFVNLHEKYAHEWAVYEMPEK